MFKYSFILFIYLTLGSLTAQSFIPQIQRSDVSGSQNLSQVDTIKILAVMVEFRPDDFDLTFGNGKFGTIYSKDYGDSILDPLPHDVRYFENHLEFAKNYYEKISKGKITVVYNVLPKIITVSKVMRDYFPSEQNNFTNLANFAKEVWEKSDSVLNGINFNNYNLFTIFHAGAGGDVITPGSIGGEKDLPSVYLGFKTLKNIYGENFSGFSVQNNSYEIRNSLILPETESREVSGIGGNFLFELSINGLLASSIGNFLGLPDLFDTETGSSAISRFGLMDGQAIFAYNGLFPPEPSPWSRIYLGWETPVTVSNGSNLVDVVTRLVSSSSDTTLIKVPINSTEYFLVENRERDALKNGAIITYKIGNNIFTKTFTKDEDNFNNNDASALAGVVVDVDEFDWALPGSGIVIWHIDEGVVKDKLSSNQINTDKLHRGVSVVEADGIPDIGEKFTTFLGDVIDGEGTSDDFWYSSNPAELYKNEFTPFSQPNTNSFTGDNSLINFSDFSDISNKMSFKLNFGSGNITLVNSKYLNLGNGKKKIEAIALNSSTNIYILDGSELKKFNNLGNSVASIDSFSSFKPAVVNLNGKELLIGLFDNQVNAYASSLLNGQKRAYSISERFSTAPVILDESKTGVQFFAGTEDGYLFKLQILESNFTAAVIDSNNIFDNKPIRQISISGNDYVVNSDFSLIDNLNNAVTLTDKIKQVVLSKDKSVLYAVVLTDGNKFYTIEAGKIIYQFKIESNNSIQSFAIADLFNNSNNYIVFTNGNKLEAYNLAGHSAENFPFVNSGSEFTGLPLTADLNNDKRAEVISFTKDGSVYAVSAGTGKNIAMFPLTTGNEVAAAALAGSDNSGQVGAMSLITLTKNNYLNNWRITGSDNLFFSSELGNRLNTSFVPAALETNIEKAFFPKNRTYNWPNPVYGNVTYIRTYVSRDADVNIKIFDLAGDLVDELHLKAIGGLDNEVAWDVSRIQSGAYLARVEVKSKSGKTGSKIIKIAVVK